MRSFASVCSSSSRSPCPAAARRTRSAGSGADIVLLKRLGSPRSTRSQTPTSGRRSTSSRKFPDQNGLDLGDPLVAEARTRLDYERDLEARARRRDLPRLAGLRKRRIECGCRDEAEGRRRVQAHVEKGNESGPDQLLFEEVDGWFVLSGHAGEDRSLPGRGRRAEARRQRALQGCAMWVLPDESLVRVLRRGAEHRRAGRRRPRTYLLECEQTSWTEFVGRPDGRKAAASSSSAPAASKPIRGPIEPFESRFLGGVPRDAIAFSRAHGRGSSNGVGNRSSQGRTSYRGLGRSRRSLGGTSASRA